MNWTVIIVVCIIASLLSEPIDRITGKRIKNKYLRFAVQLVIEIAIFATLYWIADLLGYGIRK